MVEQFAGLMLVVIFYTYLVFPVICIARGRLFPRPWKREPAEPTVSIVIICHNEAGVIKAKLDSIRALDYPSTRIQTIVGSDGSDDGTNEIVADYTGLRLQNLAFSRRGKIPALNDAVSAATGEVLVFTDANSIFEVNALRNLVRHFSDQSVGCVAGNQVYCDQTAGGVAAAGEKSFWNYDRVLKEAQSQAGNAISATGAIYAIRRNLFMKVPLGVTDDFTISTRVILQGFRLVFDGEAIASEPVAGKPNAEYRRKVRVMTRGFRSVWTVRALLNPFRFGFYSLQLFSHKILRRLVAFPIFSLLLMTPWLWHEGGWMSGMAVAQLAFYSLAILGLLFPAGPGRSKLGSIPVFFSLANLAALQAAINFTLGRTIDTWESPSDGERVGMRDSQAGVDQHLSEPTLQDAHPE